MKLRLKKLRDQVVVITGASSGIGLTTARRAAAAGASLVLAARSDDALGELVDELREQGGRAIHVMADVGDEVDVRRIAEAAIGEFGRIDTWVNIAGASVYGRCLEVSVEDMRRVFETNVWGVVYGSRVACEHLRERGGALINVGSELSDRAIPLQGLYSASKHAVKGWTDALRAELEYDGIPIAVTLIKPGPIDTPYTIHAKNYLEDQPTHVPPVYHPESAAAAILHAATHPVRELFVGGGARAMGALNRLSPRLTDAVLERTLIPGTRSGRPRRGGEALHRPGGALEERGDYDGIVRHGTYTRAAMHPMLTGAIAVGAGLLFTQAARSRAARLRAAASAADVR